MSKAWSRDMELDPGTFGGSPACHVVVDMMNRNVIPAFEKHRVLAFINSAIFEFKCIADIKRFGVRERVMFMMRDHFYDRISQMPYPEKFNSHLKNVINHHAKRYLKEVARTVAP